MQEGTPGADHKPIHRNARAEVWGPPGEAPLLPAEALAVSDTGDRRRPRWAWWHATLSPPGECPAWQQGLGEATFQEVARRVGGGGRGRVSMVREGGRANERGRQWLTGSSRKGQQQDGEEHARQCSAGGRFSGESSLDL